MNRLTALPLLGGLVLVATAALPQDPADDADDAERLDAVVQEVELLKAELVATRLALDETRALVDQTVEYVAAQAKAAEAMTKTLASSEEKGFTFGINPQSREVLLSGWRSQLAVLQKGVPRKKVAEPVPEGPHRRGRQRQR